VRGKATLHDKIKINEYRKNKENREKNHPLVNTSVIIDLARIMPRC
jgi:hypothetical protein